MVLLSLSTIRSNTNHQPIMSSYSSTIVRCFQSVRNNFNNISPISSNCHQINHLKWFLFQKAFREIDSNFWWITGRCLELYSFTHEFSSSENNRIISPFQSFIRLSGTLTETKKQKVFSGHFVHLLLQKRWFFFIPQNNYLTSNACKKSFET